MRMLVIYLIGINLLTFAIFGIDKWKARKRKFNLGIPAILVAQAFLAWFFFLR